MFFTFDSIRTITTGKSFLMLKLFNLDKIAG